MAERLNPDSIRKAIAALGNEQPAPGRLGAAVDQALSGPQQISQGPTSLDNDPAGPDDSDTHAISDVITSESRSAAHKLVAELSANNVLDDMRLQIEAQLRADTDTSNSAEDNPIDTNALEEELARLETEFSDALETGSLGEIADKNPFARIATSRAMTEMQAKITERLGEMKAIKPTPYIGHHADLRNAPVTSLLEYVRFLPETGIAFIAGNSAKNMIAEIMASADSTSQLSYNNRLFVASAVGIAMSYFAYQLRHSLYKDAQQHGHTYAQLPVGPVSASISAYKNVFKRQPIRTTFRTTMAFGVALAGGNVLLNLAGVSGKSVEFGTNVLAVTQPLEKEMRAASSVMDGFFQQIDERCRAIVQAEVDPSKAAKGTGKGAKASYGPKAAAKDFLCFGKTEGNRVPPPALVTFRNEIGLQERETISQFYKRLWDERADERTRLFNEFTTALGEFQTLVKSESDTSFATHVENATLKNIPENKIPGAKAKLIATVQAYVAEINSYGTRVDTISRRIATDGLRAAEAANQDVEIQTPKVKIATEALQALPNSPVGKTGFFLSPELAPGTKETLSKVPGLNFVTPFLSENPHLLTLQLTILALLAYLGAENIPNAFFVSRERYRSRRLAREMDPKRRDYFATLDKVAEQIADLVVEVIGPYKQLFSQVGADVQSREQLISAIKFAIAGKVDESPDGISRPILEYASEKGRAIMRMLKHLFDTGPQEAIDVDRAINKLTDFIDALKKGSLEDNAQLLREYEIPGSEIMTALFDKETAADPAKFAETVSRAEIRALRHNVRYLVLKMQARQFALSQLSARLEKGAEDTRHSTQTRDFLSRGIILPLDGAGRVTISADEVRYYRAWAELASEQEQDRKDLLKVALMGRSYWDRKFKVDHTLGTVEIPAEFSEEFVASATTQPMGDEAMLIESYAQMLNRMLERQTPQEDFSETVNFLNQRAVPDLMRELQDEPRLNDAYAVTFCCAFSARHGGPVLRCDLFNADSGNFAASVEAPYVIGESSDSASGLESQITEWFGEHGAGRLEAIARARHHELIQFVKTQTASSPETDVITFSGGELAPAEIERSRRNMLYRSMIGRQKRRIDSLGTTALDEKEMPLFELSREVFDSSLDSRNLSTRVGMNIDGLFQLEELRARLEAEPVPGLYLRLDTRRGILLASKLPQASTNPIRNALSRRKPSPPDIPYKLSALHDMDTFMQNLRRVAQSDE